MTDEKPLTIVEDGEFVETIEQPLSPKDEADIAKLNEEEPEHRPILEVWREVLEGGASEGQKKVSPSWASRIVSMYPQMKIQEMDLFRSMYFGKIDELYQILLFELSTDKKITKQLTVEDDAEFNRAHYISVITLWQTATLNWELVWNCQDEFAHVELAAISEAHKFFFGPQGLITLLDQINLRFTEDEQNELVATLEDFKGEHE